MLILRITLLSATVVPVGRWRSVRAEHAPRRGTDLARRLEAGPERSGGLVQASPLFIGSQLAITARRRLTSRLLPHCVLALLISVALLVTIDF